VSRSTANEYSHWTNSFARLHLNAGDTIVVPEKPLRPGALRSILGWTQAFSQLGVSAAAFTAIQ
jgi:hypothetical protein